MTRGLKRNETWYSVEAGRGNIGVRELVGPIFVWRSIIDTNNIYNQPDATITVY